MQKGTILLFVFFYSWLAAASTEGSCGKYLLPSPFDKQKITVSVLGAKALHFNPRFMREAADLSLRYTQSSLQEAVVKENAWLLLARYDEKIIGFLILKPNGKIYDISTIRGIGRVEVATKLLRFAMRLSGR